MKREKIGIDVDDVLARSAEGFTAYSNQRWGLNLKAENYTEDWAAFWGIPLNEAHKRAEEIHASGAFGTFRLFETAVPVLTKLAAERDLCVITSRRIVLKPETEAWLERYFPGLFGKVHYVGIWDSGRHAHHNLKQTKAQLCRELGVDYLVDDQLKHCIGAAEVGVKGLLFGNYLWNHAEELPPGVTRVRDWAAVLQYFDEQS